MHIYYIYMLVLATLYVLQDAPLFVLISSNTVVTPLVEQTNVYLIR
jgi:hypothetical protein